MSLKQTIDADIKKAMLAKEKDTLRALRAIKSLILLAESEKGNADGISEEAEMTLLAKAAKQRKDSAEIYEQQGRDDLKEPELVELAVIQKYLPQQLSEDEVRAEIKKAIAATGATSPADMGKVMGASMGALKGKADGKVISTIVKEELSA